VLPPLEYHFRRSAETCVHLPTFLLKLFNTKLYVFLELSSSDIVVCECVLTVSKCHTMVVAAPGGIIWLNLYCRMVENNEEIWRIKLRPKARRSIYRGKRIKVQRQSWFNASMDTVLGSSLEINMLHPHYL
jgi:hypothetical protein